MGFPSPGPTAQSGRALVLASRAGSDPNLPERLSSGRRGPLRAGTAVARRQVVVTSSPTFPGAFSSSRPPPAPVRALAKSPRVSDLRVSGGPAVPGASSRRAESTAHLGAVRGFRSSGLHCVDASVPKAALRPSPRSRAVALAAAAVQGQRGAGSFASAIRSGTKQPPRGGAGEARARGQNLEAADARAREAEARAPRSGGREETGRLCDLHDCDRL